MSSWCPGYTSPGRLQFLLKPISPALGPAVLPFQSCQVLPPPEAGLLLAGVLQLHYLGCVLLEHQPQLPLMLRLQAKEEEFAWAE